MAKGASAAQIREAERGFELWLRRRFSATWIAENASDLMGQANVEYAEWLRDNPPARNPVGWLLVCAERRAKNLLDTQTRRPASAPLEAVYHLADESTPTPEQRALDHDREDRLREALGFLPDKERKLLALVYFKDHSIREAGRKLGWQKSAADRHHRWALDKLRALVGDDKTVLNPATIGIVAWRVAYGDRGVWGAVLDAVLTPGREALALVLEGWEWGARQVGELGRRLSPLGDHASAAASSGGGRLIGACGFAVASVVCGIAASGVLPNGGQAALAPAVPAPLRRVVTQQSEFLPPRLEAPTLERASSPTAETEPSPPPARATARRAPRAAPPKATTRQTVNEFGVERGSAPSSESAATPTTEPTESPSSAPSGGSSSGGSAKSGNGPEFSM